MLIGFKEMFRDAILSGTKTLTIRKERKDKRRPKVGETLYFYTGLRTKSCRKFCEAECVGVSEIVMNYYGVFIDDDTLDNSGIYRLASADGFESENHFHLFFARNHKLPFKGFVIHFQVKPDAKI